MVSMFNLDLIEAFGDDRYTCVRVGLDHCSGLAIR